LILIDSGRSTLYIEHYHLLAMRTVITTSISIPITLVTKLKKDAEREGYTLEQYIIRLLELRCFQEENK
jgi:hypothetical protein